MVELFFVLILFLLVLLLDLLLISTRVSYLQTNLPRMLATRNQEDKKARQLEKILANSFRLRASLNLMLVITRFSLAGMIVWFVFLNLPALPAGIKILLVFLAAVLLFWLEWSVEKGITRNPENWALRLTGFAGIVKATASIFLFPWLLSRKAREMVEPAVHLTEDELKTLVDAGQQDGTVEQDERRMIYSIFELADTLAREIMIPRIDMQALEVKTALPAAIDSLLKSGHSRVPVYEESIDNMVGLLYAKDLLYAWYEGDQLPDLRKLLRDAYFVPEAKRVDELLEEMQAQRVHMAIVVDEYGGIAGLVTLEDIVEEIVGEIQDEYDIAEEAPYLKMKDGSYIFLGRIDLDDFNDIIGSHLPKEEAETLGGYIYSKIGRVPSVGEQIQEDDLLLTIEQISARRIRKVRITRIEEKTQNDEDHENPDR